MPAPVAPDAAAQSRMRRLLQRAKTYQSLGDLKAALSSLDEALAIQPDAVAVLLQKAELLLQQERHNDAYDAAMLATQGHIDSPLTALQLLRVLNRLSQSALMIEIVQQLPPPMWDSAKSLAEVAQELTVIGAHDLAMTFAKAGLERDPKHPPSLYLCATEDVFFGDLKSATVHAEHCLEVIPGDPSAHWLLSRTRAPGAEQRIDKIQQALQTKMDGESEAWLAYALHNELHDLRDYVPAWEALERACRAKRSVLDYSSEESGKLFDSLMQWQGKECREDGEFSSDLTPLFVIGLHRSGTTLAERILSGHSAVVAGGETYDLRAQLRRASGLHFSGELDRRIVESRDALNYKNIGRGYLQSMQWRAKGSRYVTDKLPSNYYNVGFIARALPNARIICLDRDPIDVGLSSLRTLFSSACPYSYDQLEFAAHYHRYKALVAHWCREFPDRILPVAYQDMVDAPEATAERMALFCGLKYEPAMVQIQSRSDAVATASSVMMRDGIRRDRGRVWAAYETQLQPMIQALAKVASF